MKKTTAISAKQKLMLIALPLISLPFIIFLFWSLDGGKGNKEKDIPTSPGLNMQLPSANLKNDSTENKLSFYGQAEKDSARLKEALREDPYRQQDNDTSEPTTGATLMDVTSNPADFSSGYSLAPAGKTVRLADKEAAISRQLAQLNRQLNQPEPPQKLTEGSTGAAEDHPGAIMPDNPKGSADDPELKQLSGMLDKIMDIQNPAQAAQRQKELSAKNRGQVYAVSAPQQAEAIGSVMGNAEPQAGNGFYDLNNQTGETDQPPTAVPAKVYQSQTLTNGSALRLQLTNDIFINGTKIPQGTFVTGLCTIEGDRLAAEIKTIRYRNSLFPVSMTVFDMDGIAGINVPGAITRDAAKQGADQVMQNLDFYSMNPSIGAQAASAGVQAAKGLFGKKVKLVKVNVRAGYPVLLMDQNHHE